MNRGSLFYTFGMRGYYLSFPVMAFLWGPWFLLAGTIGLIVVLRSVDFQGESFVTGLSSSGRGRHLKEGGDLDVEEGDCESEESGDKNGGAAGGNVTGLSSIVVNDSTATPVTPTTPITTTQTQGDSKLTQRGVNNANINNSTTTTKGTSFHITTHKQRHPQHQNTVIKISSKKDLAAADVDNMDNVTKAIIEATKRRESVISLGTGVGTTSAAVGTDLVALSCYPGGQELRVVGKGSTGTLGADVVGVGDLSRKVSEAEMIDD
ncbi:hypothetical protein HDU76_009378 [Blyttiomyces sp. JEL0837]|nr:hypothetical protein HDU76_009378 [Blyttiomyces sp. JEL0837]